MNKGESEFYKVVKTLGTLKICGISQQEFSNVQFGMKITKIDENYEYGTHKFYQIYLIDNGSMQDIVIGNKIVSHVVKSKTTYYRSYNEFYNRLTVSYATPSGECHDLTIFCGASNDNASGDVLYFIMYIIILIAEIDDSETLRKLCVLLLDERHTLGIGDNIEIIMSTNDKLQEIKDKYPFTAPVFDAALNKRKQQIMQGLYDAAILDKPLNLSS